MHHSSEKSVCLCEYAQKMKAWNAETQPSYNAHACIICCIHAADVGVHATDGRQGLWYYKSLKEGLNEGDFCSLIPQPLVNGTAPPLTPTDARIKHIQMDWAQACPVDSPRHTVPACLPYMHTMRQWVDIIFYVLIIS
jgi:hypothetical protein